MNKKGLSPLIATVVLITLVVVIAGIVYKSGTEFIAQLSPPADCTEVSFEAGIFQEIDGSKTIELTNKGEVKIESFALQIELNGNSDYTDLPISLGKAESIKQPLNLDITEDSQIKIIPQVKNAKGEIIKCSKEFGKLITIRQIEK